MKTPMQKIAELLALLKKEGRCKTNQDLLNLLEELSDIMRKRRRDSVYRDDKKFRQKKGAILTSDTPPEFDYIKT